MRLHGMAEAVLVFAGTCIAVLWVGAHYELASGIVIALWGVSIGRVAETLWLALRSQAASARAHP